MNAQILDFTPSPAGIGLPPQNIEAEEAVLGGILIDPDALLRVLDILEEDSFYIRANASKINKTKWTKSLVYASNARISFSVNLIFPP